jgi:hypothetical protein
MPTRPAGVPETAHGSAARQLHSLALDSRRRGCGGTHAAPPGAHTSPSAAGSRPHTTGLPRAPPAGLHWPACAAVWTASAPSGPGPPPACTCTIPAGFMRSQLSRIQRRKSCESGCWVGDRSRGRFATPADFPLHDCSPYRGLHVRREWVGVVHRSRTIFCRLVPNPKRPIRNLSVPSRVSPPGRSSPAVPRPARR